MSTRVFRPILFCAALLCPAFLSACTANVRPEVAKLLEAALVDARHDSSAGAMQQIAAAEAVPNQSPQEKQAVAEVKDHIITGNVATYIFDPRDGALSLDHGSLPQNRGIPDYNFNQSAPTAFPDAPNPP